jgi:hypothetical protein
VRLTLVGTCDNSTCPAIYESDRGTYVVQGAIVTDAQALSSVELPANETLVEVPKSLLLELAKS